MQPNWRIYWKSNNTSISSNTINNNVVAAADASGNDDVEDVNQVAAAQKKGHWHQQTAHKKTKLHPAVKLLSTLSTAVDKASSHKAGAKALELAALNVRAEAKVKIKSRELDLTEWKMEIDTKKAELELNILRLQEKEQLLLTRKQLLDASVSLEKINTMLPIN